MELKLCIIPVSSSLNSLLIVPYGIETLDLQLRVKYADCLLIVPYGIETR